jgi:hypothetical protein
MQESPVVAHAPDAIFVAMQHDGVRRMPLSFLELTTMDEIRFDSSAYDPAHVNAVLRDARRMRNELLVDLAKAIFDGRLTDRLFGRRPAEAPQLPGAAASHG